MTDQPLHPEHAIQIRKPCPKTWGELVGDDKRRFCSACSLHVHNSRQLSMVEARALVASPTQRVCMRIEYDPDGAPVFRDSVHADALATRAPRPPAVRLARWVLSTAAGLLAACHGSSSTSAAIHSATSPNISEPPSRMGKVCATELVGDVAVPPPPTIEMLGEAVGPPNPGPDAPRANGDK